VLLQDYTRRPVRRRPGRDARGHGPPGGDPRRINPLVPATW